MAENVVKNILTRLGIEDTGKYENHFYIIEMGYRMDGEKMFTIYNGVSGFDSVKWIVEASLGIKLPSAAFISSDTFI